MTDIAPRVTPGQVAADPALRAAAQALADLYLTGFSVAEWLAGADHTPVAERELVADLIDAAHVLEHAEEWVAALAGPDARACREAEPWLIDRPWPSPDGTQGSR